MQDPYDASFAAANMLLDLEIVSGMWTESEYVFQFRGEPCTDMTTCKYPNRAHTSGYNDYMWNDHVAEATGAYRLSRQLEQLWRAYFP